MIVAFIGSDNYERSATMAIRLWNVIGNLVVEEGADVFLFSNANYFDNDCFAIVSQLKMQYRNIERRYIHGGFGYDVGYVRYMSKRYDKVCFPVQEIVFYRHMRDRAMIDTCDVLVTYCSTEQLQSEQKNSTALAVEYARKKNKRIINII